MHDFAVGTPMMQLLKPPSTATNFGREQINELRRNNVVKNDVKNSHTTEAYGTRF